MQVDIFFRNIPSSERIKEFVEEKSAKLERFFNGKFHLRWTLSEEHEKSLAHLQAVGMGLELFAEADGDTFLTAVEEAVDKLEKQLQRVKEQRRDHHK